MDGQNGKPTAVPGASPAACTDEHCVTCSDAAVSCRVLRLEAGQLALVDPGGEPELVSVALVDAQPGDLILVHAGEAIAVVEES